MNIRLEMSKNVFLPCKSVDDLVRMQTPLLHVSPEDTIEKFLLHLWHITYQDFYVGSELPILINFNDTKAEYPILFSGHFDVTGNTIVVCGVTDLANHALEKWVEVFHPSPSCGIRFQCSKRKYSRWNLF